MTKVLRFPGIGLAPGGLTRFDGCCWSAGGRRPAEGPQTRRCLVFNGYRSCPWRENFVRKLLLQAEQAVRCDPVRSLRHLPPRSSRGAAATQPVALQFSPGAPPPGRLGIPLCQRTGRTSRLRQGAKPAILRSEPRRSSSLTPQWSSRCLASRRPCRTQAARRAAT